MGCHFIICKYVCIKYIASSASFNFTRHHLVELQFLNILLVWDHKCVIKKGVVYFFLDFYDVEAESTIELDLIRAYSEFFRASWIVKRYCIPPTFYSGKRFGFLFGAHFI